MKKLGFTCHLQVFFFLFFAVFAVIGLAALFWNPGHVITAAMSLTMTYATKNFW